VIAKYSHSADGPTARLYTDEVYRIIGTGVRAAGVTTEPKKVAPDLGAYAKVAPLGTQAVDYPGAIWSAASTSNYQVGRTQAITTIVIHVTQGSREGHRLARPEREPLLDRHRARGVRRPALLVHRRHVPLVCGPDPQHRRPRGIPKDRNHIKGHSEMPGNDHTDPGSRATP